NIIDLLSVTTDGRLVVIELKASPDPDLPFQALDYWIGVERHRKAGDFLRKGYFAGRPLKDETALLVLVAPLLAYHKTARRLTATLPAEVPLMEIGINQGWKKEIKVLRRKVWSVRLGDGEAYENQASARFYHRCFSGSRNFDGSGPKEGCREKRAGALWKHGPEGAREKR